MIVCCTNTDPTGGHSISDVNCFNTLSLTDTKCLHATIKVNSRPQISADEFKSYYLRDNVLSALPAQPLIALPLFHCRWTLCMFIWYRPVLLLRGWISGCVSINLIALRILFLCPSAAAGNEQKEKVKFSKQTFYLDDSQSVDCIYLVQLFQIQREDAPIVQLVIHGATDFHVRG